MYAADDGCRDVPAIVATLDEVSSSMMIHCEEVVVASPVSPGRRGNHKDEDSTPAVMPSRWDLM